MGETRPPGEWVSDTVLKADVFSRIELGHFRPGGEKAVLRDLTARKWWAAPLSAHFAWREARALTLLDGVAGVPRLLHREPGRLYRSYVPGLPLHVARPYGDADYFAEAKRILRALRRQGLTHNDLAKQPNWLRGQDGRPWLIDFQLATVHRRRGLLYRIMAYEDLRHLLKHKRFYCPDAMTAKERAVVARRSLPARLWMRTGKRLYNFVTRGLLHWSDGEGSADRLKRFGPALAKKLAAHPAVAEAAVTSYPHPRMVEGIYAFVRLSAPAGGEELADWTRRELGARAGADLVQIVPELPKTAGGVVRYDILRLIAQNLLDEIEPLTAGDRDLAALVRAIVAGRLNLTDRPAMGARPAAAAE